MKYLLIILLFISQNANSQATKYISPTGSNGAAGSFAAPWATLAYAWSQISAGDTIYMRGGTYTISGAGIALNSKVGSSSAITCIWNYPEEQPIFDWNGAVPGSAFQCISMDNTEWLHIRGLRVTNNPQMASGAFYNYGFNVNDGNVNITLERCQADSIGGSGFRIHDSNNILLLNCDAFWNDNPNGGNAHEDANGYEIAGPSAGGYINWIIKCRAWWNADDGFDTFNGTQTVIFDSCWSFWNGYLPGTFTSAGDGNGWKLGQYTFGTSSSYLRTVKNCLMFQNLTSGLDQNFADGTHGFPSKIFNNTAYDNVGLGFFTAWSFVDSVANNISYLNTTDVSHGILIGASAIEETNDWNQSGNDTAKAADFVSLDTAGVNGPRKANGDLPSLPFLHLKKGSVLINAGTANRGAGDDLGAFQFIDRIRYLFFF